MVAARENGVSTYVLTNGSPFAVSSSFFGFWLWLMKVRTSRITGTRITDSFRFRFDMIPCPGSVGAAGAHLSRDWSQLCASLALGENDHLYEGDNRRLFSACWRFSDGNTGLAPAEAPSYALSGMSSTILTYSYDH